MFQPDSVEHFVERWLAVGSPAILAGGSSTGKTFLTVQLLGLAQPHLGKLLYVATDRKTEVYREIFERNNQPLPQFFYNIVDMKREKLDSGRANELEHAVTRSQDKYEAFYWINGLVEHHKPDTLIVDVGQRVIPTTNINNPSEAAGGLELWNAWCLHHQIRCLITWHVNKRNREDLSDPFDGISGAHAIQAYMYGKFLLTRPQPGQNYYTLVGRQSLEPDIDCTLTRDDRGFFVLENETERVARIYPLAAFLPEAPEEIRRLDLFDVVRASTTSLAAFSDRTLDQMLSELVSNGIALRPRKGTYQRVRLV